VLSYGGVSLHLPSADEAAWITARIPPQEAFGFFRARWMADPILNPRVHFNWFLNRPVKVNSLFQPWGASRWGYAFILCDYKMMNAILAQNTTGNSLPFKIDDDLGSSITTSMFMLPPVPLSKLSIIPSLPLFLVPLVDERYRWWEVAAEIDLEENVSTWANVYADIGTALGVTITTDPISTDYLKPGAGLTKHFQPIPMLLDLVASSVGQRIVRRLNGSILALNATTGKALMIAQANSYVKEAGGSLDFGVVNA